MRNKSKLFVNKMKGEMEGKKVRLETYSQPQTSRQMGWL